MKSCCLDVSVDGVKAYQRDCIRYADVVRTAFERGVWGLRPNLAIFLSEDGGFSDYIRLLSPMVLNQRYSKTISFVLMSLVQLDNNAFNISDLVLRRCRVSIVVSRDKLSSDAFCALRALKQKWNIRLIVDADDDLFAIPPSHPEYAVYQKRLCMYRELLELADVVTASTRQVLEGVWSQGLRIKSHKVIPNYIDNRIWPMEDKRLASNVGCSNKIRVLYAGTETHDGDLRIIEKALPEIREQVMRDCKKSIEIVVVGGTTLNFDGMEIMRVPDNKRDYPTFSKWIQSMNRFDFAIAPLDIKNPLNKAKSALKYLEYSALGLPGIYSSIDPYTENVENGKTGMIVPDNSITSWCAAFAQLSLDREVRKTISNNARCDVRARHMLQNHFDEWVMLIESE